MNFCACGEELQMPRRVCAACKSARRVEQARQRRTEARAKGNCGTCRNRKRAPGRKQCAQCQKADRERRVFLRRDLPPEVPTEAPPEHRPQIEPPPAGNGEPLAVFMARQRERIASQCRRLVAEREPHVGAAYGDMGMTDLAIDRRRRA